MIYYNILLGTVLLSYQAHQSGPKAEDTILSKRHDDKTVRTTRRETYAKDIGHGKSKAHTSLAHPIKRSLTPVKRRQDEQYELRRRLKKLEMRLSFTGFDDDPMASKVSMVTDEK